MKKTSFRNFGEATAEEIQLVCASEEAYARKGLVPRILRELESLKVETAPYPISRYEHSLQTATRAWRDEADEEMVVAALLHDIGDSLAPADHAELAAQILKPYVSEKTHWIVAKHGIFQGYYFWHHLGMDRNAREKYRDHPWFDDCAHFCEAWDQASFDQDYESLPLEFFIPMVERIFAREPFGDHL